MTNIQLKERVLEIKEGFDKNWKNPYSEIHLRIAIEALLDGLEGIYGPLKHDGFIDTYPRRVDLVKEEIKYSKNLLDWSQATLDGEFNQLKMNYKRVSEFLHFNWFMKKILRTVLKI